MSLVVVRLLEVRSAVLNQRLGVPIPVVTGSSTSELVAVAVLVVSGRDIFIGALILILAEFHIAKASAMDAWVSLVMLTSSVRTLVEVAIDSMIIIAFFITLQVLSNLLVRLLRNLLTVLFITAFKIFSLVTTILLAVRDIFFLLQAVLLTLYSSFVLLAGELLGLALQIALLLGFLASGDSSVVHGHMMWAGLMLVIAALIAVMKGHVVGATHGASVLKGAMVMIKVLFIMRIDGAGVLVCVVSRRATLEVMFAPGMLLTASVLKVVLPAIGRLFVSPTSLMVALFETTMMSSRLIASVVAVIVLTSIIFVVKSQKLCHGNIVSLLLQKLSDGSVEEFGDRNVVLLEVFWHDCVKELNDGDFILVKELSHGRIQVEHSNNDVI